MPDNPKCPESTFLVVDEHGQIIGWPMQSVPESTLRVVEANGHRLVKFIPQHVADQQAREAVRLAIEAERAAQHREGGE